MPIYEYTCDGCGNAFEQLLRGNERAECPSCGSKRLTKQFSVPSAHTGANQPACPAQEMGQCDVSNCCGQSCNLRFDG